MNSRKDYALDPSPIGSGGYAEVFKATYKPTGERVAFKRLYLHLIRRPQSDAIVRLKREIEVLSDCVYPNIMPILAYADNYTWYTMPIASSTLYDLQKSVDDDMLLGAVRNCIDGLSVAHKKPYIHRDITPKNIL